jgi:hypothetical protein
MKTLQAQASVNRGSQRIFLLALLFWALPERAHAYVDPGLLGSLYQIIYVFVFGILAGWVLRPFKYISAKYKELKTRLSSKNSE